MQPQTTTDKSLSGMLTWAIGSDEVQEAFKNYVLFENAITVIMKIILQTNPEIQSLVYIRGLMVDDTSLCCAAIL